MDHHGICGIDPYAMEDLVMSKLEADGTLADWQGFVLPDGQAVSPRELARRVHPLLHRDHCPNRLISSTGG